MENITQHKNSTAFSPPTPHRLPTISASQALQELQSSTNRCISTGIRSLDCALQNQDPGLGNDEVKGGVQKGQVTEICGPPGVGKTALGMQLACRVLCGGEGVVWVDAANILPGQRLKQLLSSSKPTKSSRPSSSPSLDPELGMLDNFLHFSTPTLPHLIALLSHSNSSFPPPETSLIVIDSFSSLIATTYPRNVDLATMQRKPGATPKKDPQHWASTRKWTVIQYVISSLQKLAALRNIGIVILNQTVTKMNPGSRAVLISAISSPAWDTGVSTRAVLFRDWGWEGKQVRYAGVLKAQGIVIPGRRGLGKVVPFVIGDDGLESVQYPESEPLRVIDHVAIPSRKRKADEIRDSEDDEDVEGSDQEYGWAEEDIEDLPPPPPQTQGSEDILLVPELRERIEDDDEEEQEKEEDEGDEDNISVSSADGEVLF